MNIQKSGYNQQFLIYLKYRNFIYYNFDFNSNLEPILTSKEEYATCSIEHIIGGEFDIIQYLNNCTIEIWNPNIDSIVVNGELIQPLTSSMVHIKDHLYWINNSKIKYLNFKPKYPEVFKIKFSEFFNLLLLLPVKIFIVQEIIAVILLIIFNGFSTNLIIYHLVILIFCFCGYIGFYETTIEFGNKEYDTYRYNKILKVINTDIHNRSLVDVKKKCLPMKKFTLNI